MQTDGLPLAKPRPAALVKRERQAAIKARSLAEDRKVKARAGGRCEVWKQTYWTFANELPKALCDRCHRAPVGDPHHLIYGSGRRNIGKSILAAWKLAVCRQCHAEIQQHVLVPVEPLADALHVVYGRIR